MQGSHAGRAPHPQKGMAEAGGHTSLARGQGPGRPPGQPEAERLRGDPPPATNAGEPGEAAPVPSRVCWGAAHTGATPCTHCTAQHTTGHRCANEPSFSLAGGLQVILSSSF